MNRSIWLILAIITCLATVASAQDNNISVGKTDFPEKIWGKQNMTFDITNKVEWPVYVTVETEVVFEDMNKRTLPPQLTHFILMPEMTTTVTPKIEIPANYGRLTLWLRVHEVIDTLDDLFAGELVFEQPFKLMFYTVEELSGYFETPVMLPPMVERSILFGNDFSKLFLLLVEEGRSFDQIAEISNMDPSYIKSLADELVKLQFIKQNNTGYQLGFPVVNLAEARAVRSYIDTVSYKLGKQIQDNRPAFRNTRDSLINAGTLSPDSGHFFGGGAPLWEPYPLILGMTLWRDLGQLFFARDLPLDIYGITDPCNARVDKYMYLVKGGNYFNGNTFFNYQVDRNRTGFDVSATEPDFVCDAVTIGAKGQMRIDWKYAPDTYPESFLYDTTVIGPAVKVLSNGCSDIIEKFDEHLNMILADYGHDTSIPGIRLWVWNLMVSRTMATMEKEGWLTKLGNGHYRFMQKD